MKKFGKSFLIFFICILCISAVSIGVVYFRFISERIYKDSTDNLEEIYSQVNRSFGMFVERNWGLLESWDNSSALSDENEGKLPGFVAKEKEYWGFSDFYFISSDGRFMSVDGAEGSIDMGEEWGELTQNKEPVMSEASPEGKDVTVFAVPAEHGAYKGFEYDAIAVSYTNADMASSLDVDAFSGKAKCFIIHTDGSIILSTQTGGNIYSNYLVYLKGASDLSDEELSALQDEWAKGSTGIVRCRIGDEDHCILYQPVSYRDYILLSSVPQNAVSAGFLSVQKITVDVLGAIFLLLGSVVIALLLMRGHSLTRKSKLELQYRERMFDVLSNSVDDFFVMLDAEKWSVDYISPNIERLLGIPVEDALKDIRVLEKCAVADDDIVIPKDELENIPLQGSRSWEYEYMHQGTGERRWYRMTMYHMSIQDVRKYILVMSDRTLDLQMNQKLREALNAAQSANEAKSNFLSNMSHDIRTPMNAIVGFSMLLEKEADNPDKVREYTRKITASSHHLLSLINDVLDMSKIESGKTSLNVDIFSLPELLDELNIIIMPQAKAKKQQFRINVQGAPPEQLVGDKLRLNQILINLMANAIKYTPEGGKIDFNVREIPSPAPQYVTLRFDVQDNGIGMSEEFRKKVFNPFSREISSVTNKVQGTGLGMAITKNLVDLMGGIITVESKQGEGSTFTVELSFVLPDQTHSAEWFARKVSRMLVADDELDICLNIKELMRDTGVDVSFVTDGQSAVDSAVRAHDDGNDFGVILLDWKMPGMDGVQTARKIRGAIGKDVPILVLTSHDWEDIEEEARRAGINAFMSKPFFVSSFIQTIAPLFEEEEAQSAPEPSAAENIMQGKRFLIAEDNELNAEILMEILSIEGVNCELAVNGLEAVEMLERSEPGYYDMILMDVQMPVMNGYEATRKIRSSAHPEAKTIPIAAMTANTFAEDVQNAMEAGMDGHLAKPIDMNAVRELVGKLLGGK